MTLVIANHTDKPISLETVLQSCSLSQLSNSDQTSDCIVIEGCDQTTQRSTNFRMDYHRWCDKHSRIQNLRSEAQAVAWSRNKAIYCHAKVAVQYYIGMYVAAVR